MSIFDTAYEGAGPHANYAGFGVQFGMANVQVIANLITGGVCHRFPDLKFVSVESGIGWIPFALDHLDWQWKNCGVPQEHPEYDLLPSEYFKRQMYGCFWFENGTVKAAIEQMGAGLLPLRERLPAPDAHVPGTGHGGRRARAVHRRRARRPAGGRRCARSSTTTPPSSTTWIDAFSSSQRGVDGMADDYASVDVDLGRVAPATEHWQQIDALAGSAPLLPQHERQLLGADPLRRHPRGVPEPRGVLQPLDRADRPGPGYRFLPSFSDPPEHMKYRQADEPLVRAGRGRQVPAADCSGWPARRSAEVVADGAVRLPDDLRRPLPGRGFLAVDGPAAGRRRVLRRRACAACPARRRDSPSRDESAWPRGASSPPTGRTLLDRPAGRHPLDPDVDFVTHMIEQSTIDDEPDARRRHRRHHGHPHARQPRHAEEPARLVHVPPRHPSRGPAPARRPTRR